MKRLEAASLKLVGLPKRSLEHSLSLANDLGCVNYVTVYIGMSALVVCQKTRVYLMSYRKA